MLDNEFIHISIPNIDEFSLEDKANIENFKVNIQTDILALVEVAKNASFWDDSITRIIITNDYKGDIEKQAKLWNRPVKLTAEKEYVGISKTLFNYSSSKPERYIFFPLSVATMKDSFQQIILGQFISVFSEKIIQGDLKKYDSLTINLITLQDHINHSLIVWLPLNYSKRIERTIFKDYKNELNATNIFNGFCRKLKRNLFEYNSDEKDNHFRINRFWNKTYSNFTNLISRLIEIKVTNNELLLKDNTYLSLLLPILDNINDLTTKQINKTDVSIAELQENIIAFFKAFQVNLSEAENGIKIKLTKDPKDYFINSIIDTEPRFVCFLDILGFSDMIDEYDDDTTSTVLQDINEAFNNSLDTFKTNDNTPNKEALKHLQYQLFSDCVSISFPYFDREDDFLSNFNLISAFIRGFQLNMMVKGFFVRGGLSIGSYYSNKHMIFSKGLVNAYLLESKKAIYPRVLVDKKILSKIDKYSKDKVSNFGIDNYLISDWEGYTFLNPFNLTSDIVNQFERLKDEVKLDDNDELSNSLNSIMDIAFSLMKEPLKEIESKEPEMIAIIKNHIESNKQKYFETESILSKYIWIDELLKWIEDENSSELKFKYLYK
jgi:hypothetical protein